MPEVHAADAGHVDSDAGASVDRRQFMGGALSAAAGVSATLAAGAAAAQQPPGPPPGAPPGGPIGSTIEKRYGAAGPGGAVGVGPRLFREEQDIRYCEVEG